MVEGPGQGPRLDPSLSQWWDSLQVGTTYRNLKGKPVVTVFSLKAKTVVFPSCKAGF